MVTNRPALERWLSDRRITYAAAARELSENRETIRLICLPFGDSKRRVPREELMEKVFEWTEGAVAPADFYPPHLRSRETAPAEAAR